MKKFNHLLAVKGLQNIAPILFISFDEYTVEFMQYNLGSFWDVKNLRVCPQFLTSPSGTGESLFCLVSFVC